MKNATPLPGRCLLSVLLGVLVGCQEGAIDRGSSAEAISVRREAPTAEDAANATYTGIYEEPIALSQGRYEGEPFVPDGATRPRVGLLDELQLLADLDGDGEGERIVLLWESSGGSGNSLYVARVGTDRQADATLVGDRVEIRALQVHGAVVQMDVLRAGVDDAMCCPGELATLRWGMRTTGLEVVSDVISGRLDLSTVAGEWQQMSRAASRGILTIAPVPDENGTPDERVLVLSEEEAAALGLGQDVEITMTISAVGTVGGRSGCNQYSGEVRFSEPNKLAFGPLRMTLMACPGRAMQLERQYLTRLRGVTRVGFRLGKLALEWQAGGKSGVLVFVPRE